MWAISPEERVKHDQKFDTLSPSMGYVTGMRLNTRNTMTSLINSITVKRCSAHAFVLMDYHTGSYD